MALDFGTAYSQGATAARQQQAPTIAANLQNVPQLQGRLNYWGNLFQNGPNEQETADYFNQANANANFQGQANSPAAILQNVLGYQSYKRGVQENASNQLGSITSPFMLNAPQQSDASQMAVGVGQFNEGLAAQETNTDKMLGRGAYGTPDWKKAAGAVAGIGLGAAGAYFAPQILGAGAGGAAAGGITSNTGDTNSGATPGINGGAGGGAWGSLNPLQQSAMRMGFFGTGMNVGQSIFGL